MSNSDLLFNVSCYVIIFVNGTKSFIEEGFYNFDN